MPVAQLSLRRGQDLSESSRRRLWVRQEKLEKMHEAPWLLKNIGKELLQPVFRRTHQRQEQREDRCAALVTLATLQFDGQEGGEMRQRQPPELEPSLALEVRNIPVA